jgi:hypothetical protein
VATGAAQAATIEATISRANKRYNVCFISALLGVVGKRSD